MNANLEGSEKAQVLRRGKKKIIKKIYAGVTKKGKKKRYTLKINKTVWNKETEIILLGAEKIRKGDMKYT